MKFNFHAPINMQTSYGLVAINIATRVSCNILPIGQVGQDVPKSLLDRVGNEKPFDLNLPTIKLWHQFDLATIGRGKKIGYTFFELDRFNQVEMAHLNSMDEVWVATEWAKQVLAANGVNRPAKVLPLGVDPKIFAPVNYKPDNYIFFSAGKWEIRKSQDEIVGAFNAGFTPANSVELWLSMHNQFHTLEFMTAKKKEYLATPMGVAGKIKIVGPFNTQKDLARIMNMTSCGVFPSKAEGWGLETLEMMACGKPVIVTDYAGHTEFCDKSNSTLIPVDKLVPAYDGKWFFNQGNWGSFNQSDLIEAMRINFKAGNMINSSGIKTAETYSWDNLGKNINDII